MKDTIICLAGESGSGKTTIAELLENEGYNYIESYTTRPPRFQGERGHVFVEEMVFKQDIVRNANTIAYTFFNNHHYWAIRDQYQGKGTSVYIIDVPGIQTLKEKVKDATIVVIYLKVDKENRYNRMILERGIYEAKERIDHDHNNFKVIDCDYVVDANGTIEETLDLIKQVLAKEGEIDE